jgi:ketosteroid isomerase-like protein
MSLDQTIEKYHRALDEFVKGRPEFVLDLFSERDDISLATPLDPTVVGRQNVVEAAERAASYFQDGQPAHFERIVKVMTPDLAFIVENEQVKAKVGGRSDLDTIAVRVTTIFRQEEGVWKIVHRHADPIVSSQPLESIIQK